MRLPYPRRNLLDKTSCLMYNKPPLFKNSNNFPEEHRDYSLEEDLGKH